MNNHAKRIRLVAAMRADLRILENALQLTNPRAALRAEIAGEAVGELYAAMTVLDEPTETDHEPPTKRDGSASTWPAPAEERGDELRGAT